MQDQATAILSAISAKLRNAKEDAAGATALDAALSAYKKTLTLRETDVSADAEYQRNFVWYYKVRRDADWLKAYFRFMEEHKNDGAITFREILVYLSGIKHRVQKTRSNPEGLAASVEASFASKMLATIAPAHPIWDSQVANSLSCKVKGGLPQPEKIEMYVGLYEQLTAAVGQFIGTDSGQAHIREFDLRFPQYESVDPFKKIDFYLWALGKPDKK